MDAMISSSVNDTVQCALSLFDQDESREGTYGSSGAHVRTRYTKKVRSSCDFVGFQCVETHARAVLSWTCIWHASMARMPYACHQRAAGQRAATQVSAQQQANTAALTVHAAENAQAPC